METMKAKILYLLSSDSFEEYLQGVDLFCEGIQKRTLPQREIDSELMERLTAVVALEGWAQHDDYIAKLEHFIDHLPNYGELLNLEDNAGYGFQGILLFIHGIAQQQHDIKGFKANIFDESGWLLCKTGGMFVARHYGALGRQEDAAFFVDLSEWFGKIYSAQYGFLHVLHDIEDWTEDNANGFFNVMPMCAMYFQRALLHALQNVVDHPVVKAEIFDKYLDILNHTRQNMLDADEPRQAAEVDKVIAMVREKSLGKRKSAEPTSEENTADDF